MRAKKTPVGRPEADKSLITEVLRKAYPVDLTQREIAAKTGIHRNTVMKYVNKFIDEGKVEVSRKMGVWKFYRLKK